LSIADCYWELVPGSGASMRERTLAEANRCVYISGVAWVWT